MTYSYKHHKLGLWVDLYSKVCLELMAKDAIMRHFVLFIKPGLVTRYRQLRVPYVVGLPLGVGLFFSVI